MDHACLTRLYLPVYMYYIYVEMYIEYVYCIHLYSIGTPKKFLCTYIHLQTLFFDIIAIFTLTSLPNVHIDAYLVQVASVHLYIKHIEHIYGCPRPLPRALLLPLPLYRGIALRLCSRDWDS